MPHPDDITDCGDQVYSELKLVQLNLLRDYCIKLPSHKFNALRAWAMQSNRCGSPHTFHIVPRTKEEFDNFLLSKMGKR